MRPALAAIEAQPRCDGKRAVHLKALQESLGQAGYDVLVARTHRVGAHPASGITFAQAQFAQAGQALVAIDASEQALRVDWHDQRPQQCAFDIDVAHMRQDGGYHLQTLHCQP